MTTNNLTQIQYERLLYSLARALQTQRRFIKLIRTLPLDGNKTAYFVCLRGYFYSVTLSGNNVVEVARDLNADDMYGC